MSEDERRFFLILLSEYKRLWIRYQADAFVHKNPDYNPNEVFAEYFESVVGVFEPVEHALLEGLPVQVPMEDALKKLAKFGEDYHR